MNVFSKKVDTKFEDKIKSFILTNFTAILNSKQYAFWEIKHKDFSAVFYNSGKFVIQGKSIDEVLKKLGENFEFLKTDLKEAGSALKKMQVKTETSELFVKNGVIVSHIGTDESGKGDFFGPLVVAGVFIDEKNRPLFEKLGIKDSKKLKDEAMLKMALEIQKSSVYSVVAISNAKYNELYSKFKNLNNLLAWGHARVIENILEKTYCEYVLSDKFGDERLIQNALMKKGKTIKLEQRVRGEEDLAVAAASVLARATFVQKMKCLENFYGIKFPKGCNDIVKKSASEFIKKYGKERLKDVCKSHFKTFNEV